MPTVNIKGCNHVGKENPGAKGIWQFKVLNKYDVLCYVMPPEKIKRSELMHGKQFYFYDFCRLKRIKDNELCFHFSHDFCVILLNLKISTPCHP